MYNLGLILSPIIYLTMEYIEKILVSRREIPNSLEDFITAITNDIALAKSIYDTKIQEEY